MSATEQASNVVIINPGDHVLICFTNEYLTDAQVEHLREQIKPRFPDVDFTFVGGVAALAVQRQQGDPA